VRGGELGQWCRKLPMETSDHLQHRPPVAFSSIPSAWDKIIGKAPHSNYA